MFINHLKIPQETVRDKAESTSMRLTRWGFKMFLVIMTDSFLLLSFLKTYYRVLLQKVDYILKTKSELVGQIIQYYHRLVPLTPLENAERVVALNIQ